MELKVTKQFKKDLKRLEKQNKNLETLKAVIEILLTDQTLPKSYRNHKLTGDWSKHRDCHIAPDWVLIYRKEENALILERTGSHSELFKK